MVTSRSDLFYMIQIYEINIQKYQLLPQIKYLVASAYCLCFFQSIHPFLYPLPTITNVQSTRGVTLGVFVPIFSVRVQQYDFFVSIWCVRNNKKIIVFFIDYHALSVSCPWPFILNSIWCIFMCVRHLFSNFNPTVPKKKHTEPWLKNRGTYQIVTFVYRYTPSIIH